MKKIIYENKDVNLIVTSSGKKATEKEKTERLANYLYNLYEIKVENDMKNKSK